MGALTPGTVLGGCRIDAVVGRGGMGIVYRARQLDLDRDVAVKVIAPELIEDPDSRTRFLTEARAASAVEHPNVIPVHGAGIAEGRAYLVMRYVAGDDLRTVVRRDGALAAIHQAGYVHRDVKPQNVMIDAGGHVYLSDFGLAKQAMATGGPTASEQWVGTLEYVAPEQIRGERVDARTDVYALGGVLYFMLTARVPFERETDHAKLWAHLMDEPPAPSTVRPGLPAALDAVVARALAKVPGQRQPSAGDLGRAARAAAAGQAAATVERTVASGDAAPAGASATTTPSPTRLTPAAAPRPLLRRRAVTLAAVIGALGAGVLAFWLLPDGDDRNPSAVSGTGPRATAQPAATPSVPTVGRTVAGVGFRPRAIAVAAGAVWVLSIHEPRITRLDARTGHRAGAQPYVGRGAVSIAADGDMVWVAKRATGAVLGLDPRSGDVLRRVDTSMPPARIAAGPSGLWVVARETEAGPATLLRYDRDGRRLLQQTEFADGIAAIALGGGAAWVALVQERRVVRVVAGESAQQSAWLTAPATELAFGAGRLWASVPDDDSVVRIHPGSRQVVTTRAGRRPAGLAVAGGRVFVASNTTHTVDVI